MSEVRKRANGDGSKPLVGSPAETTPLSPKKSHNRFGVTDALRILGGLVLLNCALSYFVTNESVTWGWRPWFSKPANVRAWMVSHSSRNKRSSGDEHKHEHEHELTWTFQNGPVHLTDVELAGYNGQDPNKPVYLALNGTIYDVSAGRHLYGPGGSYSFFAGRDASRAFVTGCFDIDLTPDMRGAEETYVPVDTDEAEVVGENGELKRKGGSKGVTKAELKVRREREYRLARKRVDDTIEGWAKMFRGDGGKNYFEVGQVKRAPGWLDRLPKRPLCERAQKQRPRRQPE